MISSRVRSFERTQFLADVMTTGVEGGINYWAAVEDYRWFSPGLAGGTAKHTPGMPNAYATIHPAEGDEFEPRTIGIDDIARAIHLLRRNIFEEGEGVSDEIRAGILAASRENDAGGLDAGDADVLIQIALFGRVIYG